MFVLQIPIDSVCARTELEHGNSECRLCLIIEFNVRRLLAELLFVTVGIVLQLIT